MCEKIKYSGQTTAIIAANEVFEKHGSFQKPYKCDSCSGYHLTSQMTAYERFLWEKIEQVAQDSDKAEIERLNAKIKELEQDKIISSQLIKTSHDAIAIYLINNPSGFLVIGKALCARDEKNLKTLGDGYYTKVIIQFEGNYFRLNFPKEYYTAIDTVVISEIAENYDAAKKITSVFFSKKFLKSYSEIMKLQA